MTAPLSHSPVVLQPHRKAQAPPPLGGGPFPPVTAPSSWGLASPVCSEPLKTEFSGFPSQNEIQNPYQGPQDPHE